MKIMKTRTQTYLRNPWYKRKKAWVSILIPVILILAVIGYYFYRVQHFVSFINQNSGSSHTKTVDWAGTDRINIMLFGVDNRGNDPHPRTDSNILLSIDSKTHTAQMFSILRDTWFPIPGVSGYWGVAFANPGAGWFVGNNGQILKIGFVGHGDQQE